MSLAAQRRRRRLAGLLAGVLSLVLLSLASLAAGSRPIPLSEVWAAFTAFDPADDRHLVLWELRLPRTLLALPVGMALGLAGALIQAVTRNPLAEPGLLGVNSGAALAVVAGAAVFGLTKTADFVWFGFLGAGLAGAAAFLLGRAHESGVDPTRLILAGAGLSVTLGALSGLLVLNSPLEVLDVFRHWGAGSLAGRGLEAAAVAALSLAFGGVLALALTPALNALALGRELGQALGLKPEAVWLWSCLAVMILAGGATAAAGPIAFVGLAAPHAARLTAGPDHRWIAPLSALYAAALLLAADILGRLIAAPDEVAAGIVAAALGGPFFVQIARRFRMARL